MQQHIAHCWWTLLRSWSSLASYYYNEAHISVDFRPIDQRALHINTKVHFDDDVASMAGSSTAPGSIPRICFWFFRWLLYASFMPFEVNLPGYGVSLLSTPVRAHSFLRPVMAWSMHLKSLLYHCML